MIGRAAKIANYAWWLAARLRAIWVNQWEANQNKSALQSRTERAPFLLLLIWILIGSSRNFCLWRLLRWSYVRVCLEAALNEENEPLFKVIPLFEVELLNTINLRPFCQKLSVDASEIRYQKVRKNLVSHSWDLNGLKALPRFQTFSRA